MLDQDGWRLHPTTNCPCGQPALFRCNNCAVPELCKACMVGAHQGLPFHDVRASISLKNANSTSTDTLVIRNGMSDSSPTLPHHCVRWGCVSLSGTRGHCAHNRVRNDLRRYQFGGSSPWQWTSAVAPTRRVMPPRSRHKAGTLCGPTL